MVKRCTLVIIAVVVCLLFTVPQFGYTLAASVNLNVWFHTQSATAIQIMKTQLIPEFEATHPGIKVEFLTLPWEQRADKLTVAFTGGVAPDIFEIGSDLIVEDVTHGFPLPLDSMISSWDGKKSLIPESWSPTRYQGKQYGIPFALNARVIFYLSSLFEESGLSADVPPRTWEDIAVYAKKILRKNADGTIARLGANLGWSTGQAFYWYLWLNGGDVVDEATGTALFNTRAGVNTLNYLKDLYQAQGLPAKVPTINSAGVGMEYGGTWVVNGIRTSSPQLLDELRSFIPQGSGGKVYPLYINSLAISSQSKHPKEAWTFLSWFLKPENVQRYINETGILSPDLRSVRSQYMQKDMKSLQNVFTESDYARRNFIFPGVNAVNTMFGKYLAEVMDNKRPVEEALLKAEEEWNNVRDQFYGKK